MSEHKRPDHVRTFVAISLLFLGGYCIYVWAQTEPARRIPAAYSPVMVEGSGYDDPSRRKQFIEAGKEAIKYRLKDQNSAEFRNVGFVLSNLEGKQIPVVCGEVNSKNSFGAYSGFLKFVSAPPAITATEEDIADFHNVWNKLCTSN